PGANVIVKGTSLGTQTDFDGNYSINAQIGQTLTYSYVGFETKEVKIKKAGEINTVLSSGAALEEVVVTGYSENNDAIRKAMGYGIRRNNNYSSSKKERKLQGKVAGVHINPSLYGSRSNNNYV